MFGLLYAAATAIATVVSGTKCAIEEQQQIDKAKQLKAEGKNKYNLYTDRKGATRDLATGQLRSMDYICCEDEGRDQYLRDMYGNPVRNLSEERRLQRVEEAKRDPRRTVSFWKNSVKKQLLGKNGSTYCYGNQYRDLKTGDIYVCRMLGFPKEISRNYGYGKFYMDTNTGYLVREADCQVFDRKRGKYEYPEKLNNDFIEYFNNKQKEGGYYPLAREKVTSGWDMTESDIFKQVRLDAYYCNKDDVLDEP